MHKMIMMQSSLVPSPLRREREKGSGQTRIAAVSPRNAIIELRWALIRKHIGVLVVSLTLQPIEHKSHYSRPRTTDIEQYYQV